MNSIKWTSLNTVLPVIKLMAERAPIVEMKCVYPLFINHMTDVLVRESS